MDLNWKITGAGHPIFLLHGFGEDSRVWMQVAMGLEGPFRLLMPEWPGFGETPFQTFDLEQLAEAVAEKIRSNGGKALVLGHSMGGYITLALAEKHPDLLAGWGLIHSTPLPDTEERKRNRMKSVEFIERNGNQPYLDTLIPGLFAPANKGKDYVKQAREIANSSTAAGLQEALIAMTRRPDRTAVLKESKVPVLLVNGRFDELIPASQLEQWAAITPDAELVLLGESGHMGMLEQPFELRDAIFEMAMRCFKPATGE